MLAGAGQLLLAGLMGAPAQASEPAGKGAYLLVHFTSEVVDGEQIYFSVSRDGHNWHDLNGSKPVISSAVGTKGMRDPSIIRSAQGDKFFILATDLRIANGKGWDAAMHRGSTSILIFESKDLINWSPARMVDIAGAIPGAGCAWAPEAIYDEDAGDYFVYWTTISLQDGITKPRIYYSRTRDFVDFTPPRLYIDRPGAHGLIDTQIVKVTQAGGQYRYYRASGDGQITVEASNELLGKWVTIGDLRPVGLTGKDVEGPILFWLEQTREWALWVDQYATGKGYLALTSSDLSKVENFKIVPPAKISFGASKKRHGSILNISDAQFQSLVKKWPTQ